MIWNLRDLELAADPSPVAGHAFSGRSLTREAGAKLTGLGVYELPPGEKHWPYHFELGEEEWLIVIEGEVVLRTPEGERTMVAGDVACFVAGAAGAHTVRNDSGGRARFAMPSREAHFGATIYPDSGKFSIGGPGFQHRGYLGDAVPYWEGEA
ncbi:MAG TPA: cupin domain-containing protein [Gaiellaceae bacterium]|nr:cupin domain-containing protein [Gaiellaceae bacterium]